MLNTFWIHSGTISSQDDSLANNDISHKKDITLPFVPALNLAYWYIGGKIEDFIDVERTRSGKELRTWLVLFSSGLVP